MERDEAATARAAVLKRWERRIEWLLFASRWTLALFYIGLALALIFLLAVFCIEFYAMWGKLLFGMEYGILAVLSLIDLSLAANLVVIIILAGYENFVSKMEDAKNHGDRPSWMGKVGFAGLKIKLYGSIVAISGIQLLKTFMLTGFATDGIGAEPPVDLDRLGTKLMWLTIIHLTFVMTTVISALADWLTAKTDALHPSKPADLT